MFKSFAFVFSQQNATERRGQEMGQRAPQMREGWLIGTRPDWDRNRFGS
jgi:hypothetical protein